MKKIAAVLFFINCYSLAIGQYGTGEGLNKGKYAVGFRSVVERDYAQRYSCSIDSSLVGGKYPKPLILNIWYPAVAGNNKRMSYEGYLAFGSPDKTIAGWLNSYREYTTNTIALEVLGKERLKFDSADKRRLQFFLKASTSAIRDAVPQKGRFPLVIYHQGAGASFDDNTFFCEMLASHGYVVIGSSFQRNDGSALSVGGTEEGVMDAGFLLSFAQKLPFVDWNHSAMVGHSLGGQTVNYIAAKGNLPFDAMISLETTQEYYTDKERRWDYYVPYVTKNAENVKADFLFASGPPAIHELADKMKNANRYYLTIPDIAHNDYISQGIQRKWQDYQKNGAPASGTAYKTSLANYTKLCNYLLWFLNAKLKGDVSGWNKVAADQSAGMGYGFYMEEMPAGKTMEDYTREVLPAPTPRQLRYLIQSGRLTTAIQQINNSWKKGAKNPVYDPSFSFAMLDYLLNTDTAAAVKLYKTYTALLGEEAINQPFINIGEMWHYFGLRERAKTAFNRLYALNPGEAEKINKILEKYRN